MNETMLAIFNDPSKRDMAVAAAQEVKIQVLWIGTIAPVMSKGSVVVESRPFCLFRGDRLAPLTFMQNGAMSCSAP